MVALHSDRSTPQHDSFDLALDSRLRAWARSQPDAPCVIEAESGLTLTYGAVFGALLTLRRRLGARPRRIALQAPGGAVSALAWLAALTGGHTLIPLPTAAPPLEISATLKRMAPDALFIDDSDDSEAHTLREAYAQLNSPSTPDVISRRDVARWLDPDGAERPAPRQITDSKLSPRPGRVYLSTSGSTGEPKGVLLEARQIAWTAEQIRLSHGLTAADRCLTPLPFFHINAPVVSLCASLMAGGSVVIAPQFHRGQFWEQIARYYVTWASVVPTIIALLLDTDAPDVVADTLRFVRSASAPLPAAHMRRFERRFGVPVLETYGLTEAASQVCANPAPPLRRKPGSVGLPVGVALRIVTPTQESNAPLRDVVPGAVGEVCVAGPSVIASYIEGRGSSAFSEGWFRTGDLGFQDDDGYLFLTGRLRDVIIHGGENVAPREVEETLLAHPAVTEAAVVGAPDPLFGEQVIACVTLRKPWTPVLQERLRAFCAERLAKYKRPSQIIPLAAMPRTAAGKLDRPRLRALWPQLQTASQSAAPGVPAGVK